VAIKHGTFAETVTEEFYKTLHRLHNQYKLLQKPISIVFRVGIAFASVGFPEVLIETKPPAC
jgi:hypothetical protein